LIALVFSRRSWYSFIQSSNDWSTLHTAKVKEMSLCVWLNYSEFDCEIVIAIHMVSHICKQLSKLSRTW